MAKKLSARSLSRIDHDLALAQDKILNAHGGPEGTWYEDPLSRKLFLAIQRLRADLEFASAGPH